MEMSLIAFIVLTGMGGIFALATLLSEVNFHFPNTSKGVTSLKPSSIGWLAGIATILAFGILLFIH
jgi:hypothetical protein